MEKFIRYLFLCNIIIQIFRFKIKLGDKQSNFNLLIEVKLCPAKKQQ